MRILFGENANGCELTPARSSARWHAWAAAVAAAAGLTPVSYRRVAISSPYHIRMRMHGGFVAGQIPSIAASNVRVG